MPEISKKASTVISLILSILFLCTLAVCAITLPWLWKRVLDIFGESTDNYLTTLMIIYAALIPAVTAGISLFLMLRRIMAGKVFTRGTVKLIRLISWACFAEVPVCAALCVFYFSALILLLGFAFLGTVIRVFKNLTEEATAIKEENDLTV